MNSKSPRVAAFLQKEHVAYDALWVAFAEQLDAENGKLRSALLRTTGSLGLIIKGAGADGRGHKDNYEHASKVLDETC